MALSDNNVLELYGKVMQKVRENGQDERLVSWTVSLAERVGLSEQEIEDALVVDPRFGTPVIYYP